MFVSACRTLDYIFISEEWKVESAQVFPRVSNDPCGLESKAHACIDDHEHSKAEQGVSLPMVGLSATVVSSPQPSALWPSDHFIVSAILSWDKL